MAVKIRLTRMGAKKNPFYRIVAIDSRKARDGEYIEQIGYYNPVKQPAEVKINADIAKKWLSNGAQPTDTVRDLFVKEGILEGKAAKAAEKTEAEAVEEATLAAAAEKIED